jgi:hypothetical protein
MIETVRRLSRNVKRCQSGDMCLRWTAAGELGQDGVADDLAELGLRLEHAGFTRLR